jgi:hypothetical protein
MPGRGKVSRGNSSIREDPEWVRDSLACLQQ